MTEVETAQHFDPQNSLHSDPFSHNTVMSNDGSSPNRETDDSIEKEENQERIVYAIENDASEGIEGVENTQYVIIQGEGDVEGCGEDHEGAQMIYVVADGMNSEDVVRLVQQEVVPLSLEGSIVEGEELNQVEPAIAITQVKGADDLQDGVVVQMESAASDENPIHMEAVEYEHNVNVIHESAPEDSMDVSDVVEVEVPFVDSPSLERAYSATSVVGLNSRTSTPTDFLHVLPETSLAENMPKENVVVEKISYDMPVIKREILDSETCKFVFETPQENENELLIESRIHSNEELDTGPPKVKKKRRRKRKDKQIQPPACPTPLPFPFPYFDGVSPEQMTCFGWPISTSMNNFVNMPSGITDEKGVTGIDETIQPVKKKKRRRRPKDMQKLKMPSTSEDLPSTNDSTVSPQRVAEVVAVQSRYPIMSKLLKPPNQGVPSTDIPQTIDSKPEKMTSPDDLYDLDNPSASNDVTQDCFSQTITNNKPDTTESQGSSIVKENKTKIRRRKRKAEPQPNPPSPWLPMSCSGSDGLSPMMQMAPFLTDQMPNYKDFAHLPMPPGPYPAPFTPEFFVFCEKLREMWGLPNPLLQQPFKKRKKKKRKKIQNTNLDSNMTTKASENNELASEGLHNRLKEQGIIPNHTSTAEVVTVVERSEEEKINDILPDRPADNSITTVACSEVTQKVSIDTTIAKANRLFDKVPYISSPFNPSTGNPPSSLELPGTGPSHDASKPPDLKAEQPRSENPDKKKKKKRRKKRDGVLRNQHFVPPGLPANNYTEQLLNMAKYSQAHLAGDTQSLPVEKLPVSLKDTDMPPPMPPASLFLSSVSAGLPPVQPPISGMPPKFPPLPSGSVGMPPALQPEMPLGSVGSPPFFSEMPPMSQPGLPPSEPKKLQKRSRPKTNIHMTLGQIVNATIKDELEVEDSIPLPRRCSSEQPCVEGSSYKIREETHQSLKNLLSRRGAQVLNDPQNDTNSAVQGLLALNQSQPVLFPHSSASSLPSISSILPSTSQQLTSPEMSHQISREPAASTLSPTAAPDISSSNANPATPINPLLGVNHDQHPSALTDMYIHNWRPTGQYRCVLCSYSCVTKNYLFRHWLVHHNSELFAYRCPYCDFRYTYKDGVTRHVGRWHKDKPKEVVVDVPVEDEALRQFKALFNIEIQRDRLNSVSMNEDSQDQTESGHLGPSSTGSVTMAAASVPHHHSLPSLVPQHLSSAAAVSLAAAPLQQHVNTPVPMSIAPPVPVQTQLSSSGPVPGWPHIPGQLPFRPDRSREHPPTMATGLNPPLSHSVPSLSGLRHPYLTPTSQPPLAFTSHASGPPEDNHQPAVPPKKRQKSRMINHESLSVQSPISSHNFTGSIMMSSPYMPPTSYMSPLTCRPPLLGINIPAPIPTPSVLPPLSKTPPAHLSPGHHPFKPAESSVSPSAGYSKTTISPVHADEHIPCTSKMGRSWHTTPSPRVSEPDNIVSPGHKYPSQELPLASGEKPSPLKAYLISRMNTAPGAALPHYDDIVKSMNRHDVKPAAESAGFTLPVESVPPHSCNSRFNPSTTVTTGSVPTVSQREDEQGYLEHTQKELQKEQEQTVGRGEQESLAGAIGSSRSLDCVSGQSGSAVHYVEKKGVNGSTVAQTVDVNYNKTKDQLQGCVTEMTEGTDLVRAESSSTDNSGSIHSTARAMDQAEHVRRDHIDLERDRLCDTDSVNKLNTEVIGQTGSQSQNDLGMETNTSQAEVHLIDMAKESRTASEAVGQDDLLAKSEEISKSNPDVAETHQDNAVKGVPTS